MVVHHQSLWGEGAVRKLLQLLQLFSCPSNAAHVRAELRNAMEHAHTEEFWSNSESKDFEGGNIVRFPFITTCLALGSSFNPNNSGNTAHVVPFNLPWHGGDNNDGMTVIDITKTDSIRYCYLADGRSEAKLLDYQPLSATAYLEGYHKRATMTKDDDDNTGDGGSDTAHQQAAVTHAEPVLTADDEALLHLLSPFGLIDAWAIDSTWPGSLKELRIGLGPEIPDLSLPVQTKKDTISTAMYRHAFKPSLQLLRDSASAQDQSPPIVSQIVWCRTTYFESAAEIPRTSQGLLDWSHMQYDTHSSGAAVSSFPLRGTNCTMNAAAGLLRYIARIHKNNRVCGLSNSNFSVGQFGMDIAKYLALYGASDSGTAATVQPLPAILYSMAKAQFHSSAEIGPVDASEWTLLVLTDNTVLNFKARTPPVIRYAFVSAESLDSLGTLRVKDIISVFEADRNAEVDLDGVTLAENAEVQTLMPVLQAYHNHQKLLLQTKLEFSGEQDDDGWRFQAIPKYGNDMMFGSYWPVNAKEERCAD